jgi:hypothetical protein
MECFGTTDFDNNSRLITLSAIIISGLRCIMLAIGISSFAEVMRHACFVLTLPNESRYVKLIILSYESVKDTAVVVLCKDGENTDTFLYKVKEKSL